MGRIEKIIKCEICNSLGLIWEFPFAIQEKQETRVYFCSVKCIKKYNGVKKYLFEDKNGR